MLMAKLSAKFLRKDLTSSLEVHCRNFDSRFQQTLGLFPLHTRESKACPYFDDLA